MGMERVDRRRNGNLKKWRGSREREKSEYGEEGRKEGKKGKEKRGRLGIRGSSRENPYFHPSTNRGYLGQTKSSSPLFFFF